MTTYQDALDYLYSFVNFEHRRIDQYSPDHISLARPRHLLSLLGDPHLAFPAIHIAGTKGKGSVAAMCAASLRAAGLKVGLYTSPHLIEFRDRIRVLRPADGDGRIAEAELVDVVDRVRRAVVDVPDLTWFELVTAIAFRHFADQAVDAAVVEVGLGGRLDATNVLTPLVSVITSLSLDHTYLLGDTLAEIAAEKGGIIKAGVPVVVAPQRPEALATLEAIAAEQGAPLTLVGRDWTCEAPPPGSQQPRPRYRVSPGAVVSRSAAPGFIPAGSTFELALAGGHQLENACVALAALALVREHFPGLTPAAVREGLATVHWPGRLQLLARDEGRPLLLVDSAHNVDSARKLATALAQDYRYDRLWLVLGVTADKDQAGILQALLPLADAVFLTASSHPRASAAADLLHLAHELGFEARLSDSPTAAVKAAWRAAGPDDLICVAGSIFIVGDLLNQWDSLQSELLASSPPMQTETDLNEAAAS